MFNKDKKPEKFKDAETVIGASIKVKGNFHGQGDIVIEGQLDGNLRTEANLFIGDKAKIVANIEASDAIINGEIKGSLKIHQYLAVGPTARIIGDISCSEISIERGAIINGQIIYVPNSGKNSRGKTLEPADDLEEVEKE